MGGANPCFLRRYIAAVTTGRRHSRSRNFSVPSRIFSDAGRAQANSTRSSSSRRPGRECAPRPVRHLRAIGRAHQEEVEQPGLRPQVEGDVQPVEVHQALGHAGVLEELSRGLPAGEGQPGDRQRSGCWPIESRHRRSPRWGSRRRARRGLRRSGPPNAPVRTRASEASRSSGERARPSPWRRAVPS